MFRAGPVRPDAPPALDSERYAKGLQRDQDHRGVQQSDADDRADSYRAVLVGVPTAILEPVITQVIATRNFNLSAKARRFALSTWPRPTPIACWEAKYVYNFWRPQAAIRNGPSTATT